MPLKCGDTFLLPKTSGDREHLWIVITDPDLATNKAVCVNVTTQQTYSDSTCVLQPGDHPFISHTSVIFYQDARELDLTLVEKALTTGIKDFVCQAHDPCSEHLLRRIRQGLIASKHTPKGIKALCKKLWGIRQ